MPEVIDESIEGAVNSRKDEVRERSAQETRDLGRATAASTVRWALERRGRIPRGRPGEANSDPFCKPPLEWPLALTRVGLGPRTRILIVRKWPERTAPEITGSLKDLGNYAASARPTGSDSPRKLGIPRREVPPGYTATDNLAYRLSFGLSFCLSFQLAFRLLVEYRVTVYSCDGI